MIYLHLSVFQEQRDREMPYVQSRRQSRQESNSMLCVVINGHLSCTDSANLSPLCLMCE